MSTMLDRIIEEVRQLPPDEQRQLQKQLHSIIPSPTEDELEDAVERELAAEGIITLPLSSEYADEDDEKWEPITVTGQPLSEMIIEERR